jgi:hypothetical protein
MPRLVAPNDTMREVEIQGAYTGRTRRYGWQKDGTVHVESAAHVKALREAGFTVAGVSGAGAGGGYVCTGCGFHSWFRLCSRCGGEAVR